MISGSFAERVKTLRETMREREEKKRYIYKSKNADWR